MCFYLKRCLLYSTDFLYTDKTKVSEENLEGLLFCADKYKTYLLAAQCRSSVKGFISTSIVCKVMEIAHRFNETEIFEICLKKVDAHTPDFFFHRRISKHVSFLYLQNCSTGQHFCVRKSCF